MSVSTPLYSPPSSQTKPPSDPEVHAAVKGRFKQHGFVRLYKIYRYYISAGLALIGALILTMTNVTQGGKLGFVIYVPKGGFTVQASQGMVGLGVGGWCSIGGSPSCQSYRDGDFVAPDAGFSIPGTPLLTYLSNLLLAQTAFQYFLTFYTLTQAFLHFYLHMSLSLPHTHLVDLPRAATPRDEVDIRVRCEGGPLDGYTWVWWAWWAHSRGPVGVVYAVLVGVLGVVSFGMAIKFEMAVKAATGSSGVTMAPGAYVPFITLILISDQLYTAIHYIIALKSSWNLFITPPPPNPAAILLPTSEKPRQPIHRPDADTLFPSRTPSSSFPDPNQGQIGKDIDPETKRWLDAYPHDAELRPLMSDLSQGNDTEKGDENQNDDFILSEMGLLYLRPQGDKPALLVPPAGPIRLEIIEDVHLVVEETSGEEVHIGVEEMVTELESTFWWMTIEEDCLSFVSKCPECQSGGGLGTAIKQQHGVGQEGKKKLGDTPLPYTGVTGWASEMDGQTAAGESAMAAEMAFAMRKASDEADALR